MVDNFSILPSSFRDPSGFLFLKDDVLYRQINLNYEKEYDLLMHSGLYKELVGKKYLISHQEVTNILHRDAEQVYKIIKPDVIPFVSYPYEWCFSQLKQAALLTLEIEKLALGYGMTLKDASAYNVQFLNGKPIFVDTLSFDIYENGSPWVAYKQFCQHFFAPLALMRYRDIQLNRLLTIYIDGLPLDLTSSLLPKQSWFNFSVLIHIHLHAKSQKKYADNRLEVKAKFKNQNALFGLLDNLGTAITGMQWKPTDTEWKNYYLEITYSHESFEDKKRIITHFLDLANPKSVWDFGANTGIFSRLASDRNIFTLSIDIDPACVEMNFKEIISKNEKNLLPLMVDITNPSPCIGWENQERNSLLKRGPTDMIFALALLHHLSIANNVPFEKVAHFLTRLCKNLIIEYIPKDDPQVQRLLTNRKDIFTDYTVSHFEKEFSRYFSIIETCKVKNSNRVLYLMKRRD